MSNGSTLVVYHYVDPKHHQQYEQWLSKIIQEAAKFEGHSGVNIIRPAAGRKRYSIAVSFTSETNAQRWQDSTVRNILLEEARPFMVSDEEVAISTGIENWFTAEAPEINAPKRWKQWLVTTLVIWVLTMLVPPLLIPIFSAVPELALFGVSHFITAAIIVGLVIYVVMPRIAKLLGEWLHR